MSDRDRDERPSREPRAEAPEVPDAFPKRGGGDKDDNVNARFRPRR